MHSHGTRTISNHLQASGFCTLDKGLCRAVDVLLLSVLRVCTRACACARVRAACGLSSFSSCLYLSLALSPRSGGCVLLVWDVGTLWGASCRSSDLRDGGGHVLSQKLRKGGAEQSPVQTQQHFDHFDGVTRTAHWGTGAPLFFFHLSLFPLPFLADAFVSES